MYGIVISGEEFSDNLARGQGQLKDSPADLRSGDLFAFMVWPLETKTPIAYMRCGVGNVENGSATWERLGTDLTPEQIKAATANVIRRDQPIKYD
jgi:hypothetical protein